MTPLQRVVGVPLPSGDWSGDYQSFDADNCQAALYEGRDKIVAVSAFGNILWINVALVSIYRLRQARAWAKAVQRAMEGEV